MAERLGNKYWFWKWLDEYAAAVHMWVGAVSQLGPIELASYSRPLWLWICQHFQSWLLHIWWSVSLDGVESCYKKTSGIEVGRLPARLQRSSRAPKPRKSGFEPFQVSATSPTEVLWYIFGILPVYGFYWHVSSLKRPPMYSTRTVWRSQGSKRFSLWPLHLLDSIIRSWVARVVARVTFLHPCDPQTALVGGQFELEVCEVHFYFG